MSEEQQHSLEFGGSPVKADFDGTIGYQLVNRVPVITVSYTFSALTARQAEPRSSKRISALALHGYSGTVR